VLSKTVSRGVKKRGAYFQAPHGRMTDIAQYTRFRSEKRFFEIINTGSDFAQRSGCRINLRKRSRGKREADKTRRRFAAETERGGMKRQDRNRSRFSGGA
jgi:hypothetical protein